MMVNYVKAELQRPSVVGVVWIIVLGFHDWCENLHGCKKSKLYKMWLYFTILFYF